MKSEDLKKKTPFMRQGVLNDLVGNYCDENELDEVKEALKLKNLKVVNAGDKYSFILLNDLYYFIEMNSDYFAPGIIEIPVFRVEEMDFENDRLELLGVDSDRDSPLVRGLYSVVERDTYIP